MLRRKDTVACAILVGVGSLLGDREMAGDTDGERGDLRDDGASGEVGLEGAFVETKRLSSRRALARRLDVERVERGPGEGLALVLNSARCLGTLSCAVLAVRLGPE